MLRCCQILTVQNVDYNAGSIWLHPTADTPDSCCSECAANASCYLAVFYQDLCWFKRPNSDSVTLS